MNDTPERHAEDRRRALEGFVSMVSERGYVHTSVRELTTRAHISRARFYELFEDKERCFISAQRELASAVLDEVGEAIRAAEPIDAAPAALAVLTDRAENRPEVFSFLTHEATLAGPTAWQERRGMIATIGEEIERGSAGLPEGALVCDLAGGNLLGGAIRAIGIRMRRSDDRPTDLRDGLGAWLESYRVARGAEGWDGLVANAGPQPGARELSLAPSEPSALPRGRRRLPDDVAKRSQRERVVHATGRVITANGYPSATVADIVAAAGVSREVFYEHFHDKREAFAETIKLVFEQVIAASAGAYFSTSGSWPERIWEAGQAFVGFIVAQPEIAHGVFLEPYAVGEDLQRGDDFLLGFTVFLEDGYRYRPEAAQIPRIAGEAIGGAVLEAINDYLRSGRTEALPELVPGVVYVILAPFMGTEAAYDFVLQKTTRESNAL